MMFVIKNVDVERVNLLMNDFASGLPSPLAFLGLGASMAISLGLEKKWGIRVLPVIHALSVSQGRTLPARWIGKSPGKGKEKPFTSPESMEDRIGSISCTIFLDIPGCDDEKEVERAFIGKSVAGGNVKNNTSDIRVEIVTPDGTALNHARRGFIITCPLDAERRHISWGNPQDLAKISRVLAPDVKKKGDGWLVPAAVGYKLFDDDIYQPALRKGTRDDTIPHAFCDPVVGIAELVSVRNPKLTSLDSDGFDSLFWRWDTRGNFILGHDKYHNCYN